MYKTTENNDKNLIFESQVVGEAFKHGDVQPGTVHHGQLDLGVEDGGDQEDGKPLHHLPQVQVRSDPGILHPPDLHPPHHHRHELLGSFLVSIKNFVEVQVSFWLIKTDMGHETAARTGLGATSTLAVVTIGFGGKTKPQVILQQCYKYAILYSPQI